MQETTDKKQRICSFATCGADAELIPEHKRQKRKQTGSAITGRKCTGNHQVHLNSLVTLNEINESVTV
jgi:hypothetical protein